jgi:aminopeptidase N
MHNASTSSEERTKLAAALTNFGQPELIQRALRLITTDAVRLQDAMYWIAYSFMNRHARLATWGWLVKNWSWLEENLGTDLAFYRMPIYSARVMSDANFLPHYKKFFETVSSPGLERSIQQGIEIIEWQSAWRDRDLAAVKAFFAAKA